ncbi:MAG TPA: type II CAAX endopeptidase family protein [Rhizomicrobium sp.]|jgi:membrane protease YdiL (CAAX protease family)|nr:type II CAAX endopeptidase family protein [Rhizomicrobium sp.]
MDDTNAAPPRANRVITIIGLLIALGLPFCHLSDLGQKVSGLGDTWGSDVLWWGLFAVIILYVLVVERRGLSSIGYRRPGAWDIAIGVLAGIVMFMGTGTIFQFLLPALHLSMAHQLQTVTATPMLFRIANVTRAVVVEETAFRGYGFERLSELTGSTVLAGLVTFVLFTLAHYSGGGLAQVIIAAFGGLVLTLLYMWRRNIWTNIIAHWLTDGSAFILLPLLTAHH